MCQLCKEALDLLTERFGAKDAEQLLWNATCFPFSGEQALKQATELVALATVEEAYQHAVPREDER